MIPTGFATERGAPAPSAGPASEDGARFEIRLSRARPSTVVIALIGNHDPAAAGTLGRIAHGEMRHCDRLILDFTDTEHIDTDVVTTLVEIAMRARTDGIRLLIVSHHGTFAHDLLDTFGLLHRLDCADRLPEIEP